MRVKPFCTGHRWSLACPNASNAADYGAHRGELICTNPQKHTHVYPCLSIDWELSCMVSTRNDIFIPGSGVSK